MILRKITLSGLSKPDVYLDFQKGLNVVAGASNTGKSYIVQCIKFILGASEVPNSIKESKGYTAVSVLFEEDSGEQFILKREIAKDSNILHEELKTKSNIELKRIHGQGFTNLSNFFLRKCNLNNKQLLFSKENLTTKSLSLRILENIFVIDETRIVAKYSPMGTGQRTERTLESSLLATLLTGNDDVEAQQKKLTTNSQTTNKRKAQDLKEFIEKIYPVDPNIENQFEREKTELEKLELELSKANQAVTELISINSGLLNERTEIQTNLSFIESRLNEDSILRDRFVLLKEKLESDRSRLVGIEEAATVFDTYTDIFCPTCGKEFNEDTSDHDMLLVIESASAEKNKINQQLLDLTEAISKLEKNIKADADKKLLLNDRFEQISSTLNADIQSKIEYANVIQSQVFSKQSEVDRKTVFLNSRSLALLELNLLTPESAEKPQLYELNFCKNEKDLLAKEIQLILERWGYPNYAPTEFIDVLRDISIGGSPRSHLGKGFRAIAFSAFILGLMVATSKAKRHPGFVVLDSPLTTYKKADKDRGETDESVEEDMVYSFYRDLCDSYKDQQIIIFENQEPDLDLQKLMTYHHFSKNINVGRYGFFNPTSE